MNGSFIKHRPKNGNGRILISKHEHHEDYNMERLMVIFSTDCQGIYDENDNENVINILNTKMDVLESLFVNNLKCLTRHRINKYYKHYDKNKRISFLNINKENLNCIHSESIQFDYNQHCVDMFAYEPIFHLNSNNYKIYENPSEYQCISENTASSRFSSTFPWGLNSISHGVSYNSTKGNYSYPNTSIDNGVDLIIIDSGVLSNHIEFYDDQVVHILGDGPATFKPYGNNTYLTWYADHGTHVSGIAGGINYGASKGLKIYDYRVCVFPAEANNYDDHPCYISLFFDAFDGIINQLTNNKGRRVVINISIGGGRSIFQIYQYYFNMITSLGGIVVISAGNDNHDSCLNEPAFLRSAITVGAYNISRQKADFSNFGKCVDIWAPGVNIWSSVVACPGCDACGTCIGHKDGTSMATPFITGMVANILYVNPTLTFSQIKTILNQNRVKITGEQCNSNEIPCYGAVYQCNDTYSNISDYVETNVNVTNQITPKDEYNLNTELSNMYNCSAMIAYEYDVEGKYSSMSSYGVNQCYSTRIYQGGVPYSSQYQCNYTNNSINLIAYENSTDCSSTSEAQIINTFYNGQFDGIFKYFIHCNPKSNDSICNIKQREYSTLSNDDCLSDVYNGAKYDDYMYVKGVCYDSQTNGKSYQLTCINNIIYADFYYNGNDSDSLVTTCNPDHFEEREIFLQQNECKYDSKENLYTDYIIDCGLNAPIYPMHEYNFDNEYSNVYNCNAIVRFKYNQNGDYESMLTNAADQCYSYRSSINESPHSYMYRCNFTDNTVDYLSYYNNPNCTSTPTVRTINNREFDGTYKYFINCNPNADNIMCNIKTRKYETYTYDDCLYDNSGAKYYDSIYLKGLCYDDGPKGRSYTVSCVNETVYVDRYFNGDDLDMLVTTCNPNNWILRSRVLEPNNKCVYDDEEQMYDKYMIDCGTTVPFTFDPTPRPTFSPTPPPTDPNDEYNFNDEFSNIYNCSALVEYEYDETGNFSKMLTYAVDECYSYRLSQNAMASSEMYRCNSVDNSIDVLYYADSSNCSSTPRLIRSIQNKEFDGNKKYFVNCNSNADDNKCIIKARHYGTLTNNDCLYNHTGAKYYDVMYQKGLCYDSSINGKSYQLICINNTVYADYYYDDNTSDILVTSCNPNNFEERKVYQESNKCSFVDTENLWDDAVIECGEEFPFTFKPTLKPTIYPDEEYNLNEKYTNLYNCSVMMHLKYESGKYIATYSAAIDQCYSVSLSENGISYSFMNRCNFVNNTIDILNYTNNTDCSSTPQITKTIRNGEYDGTYKYFINCNLNANDDFCNIKIRHYETSTNYDCLYNQTESKYNDFIPQKGVCYDSATDGFSFSYKCIDNVLYRDYFIALTKDSFITKCDPLNWQQTQSLYQENNCKYNEDTDLYDSYVIDCGSTLNPSMKPTISPTTSPTSPTTASPTTTTTIPTKYPSTNIPSRQPTLEGYEPTVSPTMMISPTSNNGTGGDNGENAKTGLDAVPSFVWLVLVVVFALLFVLFLLLWCKKKKDVNSITDQMSNPNAGTPYVQLTDDADDKKL